MSFNSTFALAQPSDIQAQIQALLAQIKQLQALIVQLQNGSQSSSCVDLSSNLTLGSTGNDVTSLQNYLIAKGDLDAQYNTGYYGFITAQAVGKLQMNLNIVSSQNDTAFGIMGPKTRAAVGCTQHINGSFSATPTSGSVPLNVAFTGSELTDPSAKYLVEFGEGTNSGIQFPWCPQGYAPCSLNGISHTYAAAGTYHAQLLNQSSAAGCGGDTYCKGTVVGTATITVTSSNSTQPSATIDQDSITNPAYDQILSGTSAGLQSVCIGIVQLKQGGGLSYSSYPWNVNDSCSVPVVNGRWSIKVSPGTFSVISQDNSCNQTPPIDPKHFVCGFRCDGLETGNYSVTVWSSPDAGHLNELAGKTVSVTNFTFCEP